MSERTRPPGTQNPNADEDGRHCSYALRKSAASLLEAQGLRATSRGDVDDAIAVATHVRDAATTILDQSVLTPW